MKRMFDEQSGAVNVYALMLIIPIFVFHAVLIDFLRVRLAERDAENAVKAGARSLLARFDPALRSYGLFGLTDGEEARDELFSRVSSGNLPSEAPGAFSFSAVRLMTESAKIAVVQSLANPNVFMHQVQMEMRYRAPIEYALEVADKWKQSGVTAELKGAEAYAASAEELESLLEERETAMDEAWQAAQTYTGRAKLAYESSFQLLTDLHSLALDIGIVDVNDIRRTLSDIDDQLAEGRNTLQQLKDSLAQVSTGTPGSLLKEAGDAIDSSRALIEQTQSIRSSIDSVETSLTELERKKDDLETFLRKTAEYAVKVGLSKAAIQREHEQVAAALEPVMNKIEKAREANEKLAQAKEKKLVQMRAEKNEAEQVFEAVRVYAMNELGEYQTEAGKIAALLNGVKLEWGDTTWFSGGAFNTLSTSLETYSDQIDQFIESRRTAEQKRQTANLERAGGKAEQVGKVRQTVRQLQTKLLGCGEKATGDGYSNLYGQLRGFYDKYALFAGVPADSSSAAVIDETLSNGRMASSFASHLADLLLNVRSEIYMDEYALTKFGFRTNPDPGGGIYGQTIDGQEVEYALYGLSSCTANYAAAYGEMFLLLMAVRTTEELLSPKGAAAAGSPLLMFLSAAADAAVKAALDMNKLTDGGEIPIIRKLPQIQISYKDLLRLFLILHSDDNRTRARLQALIELRTGIDLAQAYTYIQATSDASVRLWFPSLLQDGLQRLGLTSCERSGSECRLSKTAVAAYE